MPLHDWTRVTDNVFHAFHVSWIVEIAKDLNRSVLPEGYLARPEEWVGPYESDLLAVDVGGAADSSATGQEGTVCTHDLTATIAPPRLRMRREHRIAVFSEREERRVAIVEVLSPGNKDSERRARAFEEKILVCLGSDLHVVLVDVLPPTNSAPGFAAAVARAMGSDGVSERGWSATSFECQPAVPAVRVYHRSLSIGQPLPDTPLFLEPGLHVDLRLEPTYLESVSSMPAPDRKRLQAGAPA